VRKCVLECTYAVGTSISGGGQDHGQVEDLSDGSMRHDVVLVQSWVPVSCDVVEADLDVENEKNLVRQSAMLQLFLGISDTYGVVLVNALPWDGFSMSAATQKRGQRSYSHRERRWRGQQPRSRW
jgi:hypothetical protein